MSRQLLAFVLALLGIGGRAYALEWPDLLSVPAVESRPDSSRLALSSAQESYLNSYESSNSLSIRRNDSLRSLEQGCDYGVSGDRGLDLWHHHIEFPGAFTRQLPFSWFHEAGMEWAPSVVVNRKRSVDNPDSTAGNAMISLRTGPTASFRYLDLPVLVGMGGAFDGWHDGLCRDLGRTHLSRLHTDPGFYGILNVGDDGRRLARNVPLYAGGAIRGTYMDSSKITNGRISGLFAHELPFSDTIFVFCADTLLVGRAGFLSGGAGSSAQYTTTRDQTHNSLQAAVGIRDIGEFFLRPSVWYGFRLISTSYDPLEGLLILNDERFTRHTVSCIVDNGDQGFVEYSGGVQFDFDYEDRLYNARLPRKLTGSNEDSLRQNLNDYRGFGARMEHTVSKHFGDDVGLDYLFEVRRYEETYPNYYLDEFNDTVRNQYNDDRDKVNLRHRFDVALFSSRSFSVTGHGELVKSILSFQRSASSARNSTSRTYKLETDFSWSMIGGRWVLDETVGAVAKADEYHYPEYAGRFPPYSRRFYSKLEATWRISERWRLEGSWDEVYWDQGYWDGREYRSPTSADTTSPDHYAIESKSLDTSVRLAWVCSVPGFLEIEVGSSFRDMFYRQWNPVESRYKVPLFDMGYILRPYVEADLYLWKRTALQAEVRPYLSVRRVRENGHDQFRFDKERSYVDVAASLEMSF